MGVDKTNTIWDGLILRTSLSDDGTIPRKVTSSSPDIICSGTIPPGNPNEYSDPGNYKKAYSNKIYNNIGNYFYVRAKNLSTSAKTGYLHCYWAQSNLILLPSLWKNNFMKTSDSSEGVRVDAKTEGKIVANGDDAFTWEPTTPDKNTHYCLLAQASESIDPAVGIPDKNFPSGAAWADWFAQNGNWAWRNTVYVAADSPDVPATSHHIQIPGQKTDPTELYNIYIKCTNVPPGWSFQFSSGTIIPNDPDHSNPIKTLTKSKTNVTDPNDNIGGHWYLPPQFDTDISLSVWFNGIPPNADTEWQLKITQVSDDISLSVYDMALPLMIYDNPHPAIKEWQATNESRAKNNEPIGKEIECGNIEFELIK